MRQILIIFGLFVFLNAQSIRPEIETIDKTEFGRTLIDALQIHLGQNDPLSKVFDSIREMEERIDDQQREDDSRQREFQESCDKDLSQYELDISLQNRKTVDFKSNLDEFQTEKDLLQQSLKVKNIWNNELKGRLDKVEREREKQKKQYDQIISENEYVIYIIGSVKSTFYNEGYSFLQVKQNHASILAKTISNAQKEADKFTFQKSYLSFFEVLGQMSESLVRDDEAINRLFKICDDIMRTVEDSQTLVRKMEDKSVSIYQKQKELLQKDFNKSQGDIAELQASLETSNNKIQNTQKDIDDASQRQESLQRTKEDRNQECKENAYNYEQERKDNNKKLSLISNVIGLYATNQREFKEYIAQRK